MTLDNSGNLGIGTASPATYGSGITTIDVEGTNGGGIKFGTGSASYGVYLNSTAGYVQTFNSTPIIVATNNVERMRIDASGNVGIGTASPTSKFQVNGGVTINGSSFPSSGVGLELAWDGNESVIQSYNRNTTSYQPIWIEAGSYTRFGMNGGEAMRIDSSGNLLVGTTSASATGLTVKTSSSTTSGVGYFYNIHNVSGDYCAVFAMDSNTNNTSSIFLQCTNPGVSNRFTIYGNGTYGTVSDINLKKNIQTARNGYLNDLLKFRLVKYNWNTQTDDEPKELGFIAQEVEEIFPSLIQESKVDGTDISYKQIKTSVIPFILVKAIQELSAKNDALEAINAAFETRLAILENNK
jgi:hypothetical protein